MAEDTELLKKQDADGLSVEEAPLYAQVFLYGVSVPVLVAWWVGLNHWFMHHTLLFWVIFLIGWCVLQPLINLFTNVLITFYWRYYGHKYHTGS